MKLRNRRVLYLTGLLAMVSVPAEATVQIVLMRPAPGAPQPVGTPIVWSVAATDSNPGPLTFQFNVAAPGRPFALARDFNVGVLNSGTWMCPAFVWTPTTTDGVYQIQLVVKDFTSGETASGTMRFQVTPLVTAGMPVAVPTDNPLVALFSAPACAAGSSMRVVFQPQSRNAPPAATNWANCHPPTSMNFEIASMYPQTTYTMFYQVATGGRVTNGPTLSFTAGSLPPNLPLPTVQVQLPAGGQTDTSESVLLLNPMQFIGGFNYPVIATDLAGGIIWYYYPRNSNRVAVVGRPLPNGTLLTIENNPAWNPATKKAQILRQVDLAGNVIRETNTGVIQQQLLALGATDAQACSAFPSPAPVGSACLGSFHHDAIQSLPNGYTTVLCDIEKIFPPGTQGDTSGLPVDVIGDMIVALNTNWQVVWYSDSFQHDGGGSQLDINRPAVLGETCAIGQPGCPPVFLLGPGIAPLAKDWLHANSLYYWPRDGSIIWSSRHQDWVVKVDYNNGSGTGNILWRMGRDGDFTFNNVYNDLWPWFSHQHDAGMENNGAGPLTIFDNGNTRVSQLGGGNSRGMALQIDEAQMQVTPLLGVDLGVFSLAMGSAQLLSGGNYFFLDAMAPPAPSFPYSYSIEIVPTAGTATGTQSLNLQGPESYRAWRMPSLYQPPTT